MNILCARYSTQKNDESHGQTLLCIDCIKLPTDTKQNFLAAVTTAAPALYVISLRDIDNILPWSDILADAGTKKPDIELYRAYKGYNKIPVLRGKYAWSGKTELSFKSFLSRLLSESGKNKISNAYILAMDDAILLKLFEKNSSDFAQAMKIPAPAPKSFLKNSGSMTTGHQTKELDKVLIGNSPQMRRVREQVILAGQHTQNILLLGDTGTGKTLAARAIHANSSCRDYPFTTFACGCVTGTLFESELFGHVKGAFTEAKTDRKGLWREAENGTLFFDEIGELPLDQQKKILDALGRRVIRPVGSDREIKVNARLIFATNQDLDAMVQQGSFREDLYWRIRYITIEMPPLDTLRNSIRHLAEKIWDTVCCDSNDQPLSEQILSCLESISWPGNVRSLKAVLKSLYYNDINKRPKDLRDLQNVLGVMQLGTARSGQADELKPDEVDLHRVRCLRHLKKTEEWVRACQRLFETFLSHPEKKQPGKEKMLAKIDPVLLSNRIEQVRNYVCDPLLFFEEDAFLAINRLYADIVRFNGLLLNQQWKDGARYLSQELAGDFANAQTLLFKSVQALLK